ncbi:hypothetical protein V2J09_021168 [Rumex salicifolius]
MSARLLRKVLKEQEQIQCQNDNDVIHDEDEEPDETETESRGHLKNPFDVLNVDDDDDEKEQEDEPEVIKDSAKEKIDIQISHKADISSFSGPSSSKKSKKKKKRKSKEVTTSTVGSLDLVLETLSLDAKVNQDDTNAADVKIGEKLRKQSKHSVLKVDPKFLNAENELRRIFGSKVVKSFENTSQAGSSRQVRSGRRGVHIHRKSIFLSPSEHWPRWDGSLSMELLETKDGCSYFRYVHSPSSSHTQKAFEAAKAIHDLNGVASVLMHHPYHVDSLITLADYFKFSGEPNMAADSLAKCLYALECAWHPMFSPLQGDCRLEYTHETNQPLFSTLFTHMKNLDRRGCHRSALEVCKLLLSLDPADPLGALFCVDYFALRAGEYAWLEHFSEEYQCDNYLWNFPNMAFSLATCRFFLEREESSGKSEIENQKESSIYLMKQALMLHPPVLGRLVDKVPLKDQAWKNILKHGLFKSEDTGIPSLDHLIRIFVERSHIIWRLPDVQKLLKDAALLAIETLSHDPSEAKTWACARKEAFQSEKNEYRHLLVSDFSDAVATMPPENLQDFMIDPRIQEMVANQNQNPIPDGQPQGRAARDLVNRSPLAVLFESVLPWAYYGDESDDDHHHQPDA